MLIKSCLLSIANQCGRLLKVVESNKLVLEPNEQLALESCSSMIEDLIIKYKDLIPKSQTRLG
jgi:hypothetical protein